MEFEEKVEKIYFAKKRKPLIAGLLALFYVPLIVGIAVVKFNTPKTDVSLYPVETPPPPGGGACYKEVEVLEPPSDEPRIEIKKYTNGQDANDPTGPSIRIGDRVVWRYKVTNTGNTTLSSITIEDDKLGSITCEAIPDSLAPNESFFCEKEGVAVEGQYANEATVTAVSEESGTDVTDSDPSHYIGEQEPEINHNPLCTDLRATPNEGSADLKVRFDVFAEDEDGDSIEQYQYTYGDGGYAESGADSIYHTYTKPGRYKASVVVIDEFGNESSEGECESTIVVKEETHMECLNQACVEVTGSGADKCSSDIQCQTGAQTHLECVGNTCQTVSGAGGNLCSTNADCGEPVTEVPDTGNSSTGLVVLGISLVLMLFGAKVFLR